MTTKKLYIIGLFGAVSFFFLMPASAFARDWKLWYRYPAREWEEALPVGNGRIGGMVFGGIDRERISLNEESIWSGTPVPKEATNVHQLVIKKQRELYFAGKPHEAKKVNTSNVEISPDFDVRKEKIEGTSRSRHIYKPLADLYLHFGSTRELPSDYYRDLDLDRAVATVKYNSAGINYTREVFCSHPDQVMVVRVTADKPGQISFNTKMTRRIDVKADMYRYDAELGAKVESITRPPDPVIRVISPGRFSFSGQADPDGVEFTAHFQVIAQGGNVKRIPEGFEVEDADSAVLYVTAATDYNHENPDDIACSHMDSVSRKSFDELLQRHVEDHQSLFRRVDIDLGTSRNAEMPTDKRVLAHQLGIKDCRVPEDMERDPDLYALYFQYGRYLMIACSRPGTMPPALQGIWNDSLLPPWFGGHTSDINVEMNYWPVETCNLSECHRALLDFVEGFSDAASKSADISYGCRGMVVNGMTIWGPKTAASNWQDFGGWLSQHFWEHYAFTGDEEYLAEHAYPFMKENALFYLDFMVKDPRNGWLLTGPAYSPENQFLYPDGSRGHSDMGVTMSLAIIRDLFENTIKAGEILGVDPGLRSQMKAALDDLAPYQIGIFGQLQEWLFDYDEVYPGHRHMSHLFGVAPGYSITPRTTTELAEAAKKSLIRRLDNNGGWTGWSRAWALNLAARLKDGELARQQLQLQLERTTFYNLFDSHPRKGGNTICFQIEGNFGSIAGMAEMFLQSHEDYIELMPAHPSAWKKGYVKGLRARGGFEVDIAWDDGKLTEAVIKSLNGKDCRVRYGDKIIKLKTEPGKNYKFNESLKLI
ncbi:Trehalose and maltose hydrolases (possible phosphorylases) [Limihaloglobus sulfuriphilus]|uniref:Trehalose and maltose hydrolases (Possible phosphorylases) n=1 Tax=Limihaloglobus sulfuriphilus TaxID=1851148 RepID=A0A1R7T685_9BACT|nr:glycoside hydrolase family 95 protein [Limihaloglobus sulfuriphilus]AQQ72493.1 Trehalose and maltose hydrolases (possible phosphorylases) [Limihaloglobus sulfuriphilus]